MDNLGHDENITPISDEIEENGISTSILYKYLRRRKP